MIFEWRFLPSAGVKIYNSALPCSHWTYSHTYKAALEGVHVLRVKKSKTVCPVHKNSGCNCLQRISSLGFCSYIPSSFQTVCLLPFHLFLWFFSAGQPFPRFHALLFYNFCPNSASSHLLLIPLLLCMTPWIPIQCSTSMLLLNVTPYETLMLICSWNTNRKI